MKHKIIEKEACMKKACNMILRRFKMTPEEITPENALTVLVDILSNTALWQKDPNIRICCKTIGARIIGLETKIDNAVAILKP